MLALSRPDLKLPEIGLGANYSLSPAGVVYHTPSVLSEDQSFLIPSPLPPDLKTSSSPGVKAVTPYKELLTTPLPLSLPELLSKETSHV